MIPSLTFNRSMLSTYLTCQRQFQLRYVDHLPWPASIVDEQIEHSRLMGERYHQLIQRFLMGIEVRPTPDEDPELAAWLNRFRNWSSSLPAGDRLVELNLTVPIASHYLTGRLDLLIIGDDEAYIFDWKSAVRPPIPETLWRDMQTRFYLALVAEGGEALNLDLEPANISLTYWYPNEPPVQVLLEYSQESHRENWTILNDLVAGVDWLMGQESKWPKTANLDSCRRCPYQIICGRQVGSIDLGGWDQLLDEGSIEPDDP